MKLQLRNKKKHTIKIGTNKNNEINIFNLGVLLQFESHAWQATKRVAQDKVTKKFGKEGEKGWLRANKSLINRKKLRDINDYIREARDYIKSNSLPFPIKGIDFIPHEKVDKVNEKLQEINEKFKEAVDKFCQQYDEFIADAEENLGPEYFNPSDYPRDIREKFSIYWRFFEMTLPSKITNELYEEESKRFKEMMEETKQMGILALREGFSEIVNHLTDVLSEKIDGKERRIHQSTIDKVNEFFTEFQSKNVFKDAELEDIINKAKKIVTGVTTKDLKTDQDLVKTMHKKLGAVKTDLDKSIVTFRRKLSV